MKLGLLKCDPRPFELQYAAWLPDVDWCVYDVHLGQLPASPDECEGWVGTGSRYSVYDDEPWIHAYAELVREYHKADAPFVGICFGYQMIAHALGGRVGRNPDGWCVGIHQCRVYQRATWMAPPLDSFGLVMSCQDHIEALPPGAAQLAEGMFQIGRMLGLKGHPEYTPEYSASLMELRRERIGEERVKAGMASLGDPRHPEELGVWIRNFLAGK
jgi:GMP synthase-like glutamine amidotransferase